jgi:hypothetical protein
MTYDSTRDTLNHIENVRSKLLRVISEFVGRAFKHDASKLLPPEKEAYDLYTPGLRDLEYGSEEYKNVLKKMQPAIEHHYSVSRHHPEFFVDGINGMNLIDMIEMLCDWKAAGERHTTKHVDIFRSIDINVERFKIDPQLAQILKNTANYLWYD